MGQVPHFLCAECRTKDKHFVHAPIEATDGSAVAAGRGIPVTNLRAPKTQGQNAEKHGNLSTVSSNPASLYTPAWRNFHSC
jgi:hypothetical protein